jgi:uncharacterized protein (DUF736 family)
MTRRMVCVGLLVVCSTMVSTQTRVSAQAAGRTDGWVVLSVPDYHALRAKARPPQPPPDPPPADATITQIAYELIAADDVATGSAQVTIDVLKDGWVSVPLPKGLNIREARLAGTPLVLVDSTEASATRRVFLSQKGRSLVTLDIVVPIAARAGVEQLALPSSGGLVRAALTLARPDVEVTATGGLIVERAPAPQGLRVVTHAAAGQALSLAWHRKRDATRSALPLRLRANVQQAIGLGEEIGQMTARVTADVVQGAVSTLALQLPAGLVINQVQGAHVADWEVQGASLKVTLLEPVERQVTVLVTGELRPPATGRIDIPLVQVVDAERETGGVVVEVLGAGEVTTHEARGLDPADPSDLAELVAGRTSPALVAYRYRGQQGTANPRALALTISRYAPQTVLLAAVDEARYRLLLTEDGKALVEGRLAVRNNQRSFLGVKLPAGATLWSASIDGRPIRPGKGQDGLLLLPLQKRRAGEDAPAFAIDLVYVDRGAAWEPTGTLQVTLPSIDVPVSRTGIAVHHSPRFRVSLQPGVFRAQPYEPPLSAVLHVPEPLGVGAGASPTDLAASGQGLSSGSGGGGRSAAGGVDEANFSARAPGQIDEQQLVLGERRGLVDRFQREARGARAAGVLPVAIAFPEVGPMVYLAAELTPEGSAPLASFTFKRTVK